MFLLICVTIYKLIYKYTYFFFYFVNRLYSLLMDTLSSYEIPKYFCSDRGTHFKYKEMKNVSKK